MLCCSGFSASVPFVLSGAKLANFFYAPKKCTLSESYSLPPVTFQLSLMMTTKMSVSCFLCCPGLYVGHNSGDRNRTPFGVCVSGSCIIILYEIQALGGGVFASQMVLSAGAQGTVAQNVKEPVCFQAVRAWAENLYDAHSSLVAESVLPVAVSWQAAHPVSFLLAIYTHSRSQRQSLLLLVITRTIDALGFFWTSVWSCVSSTDAIV